MIELTKEEAIKLANLLDDCRGFGGSSFRLECMEAEQLLRDKLRLSSSQPVITKGLGR
jgi:hypothetical protein